MFDADVTLDDIAVGDIAVTCVCDIVVVDVVALGDAVSVMMKNALFDVNGLIFNAKSCKVITNNVC